jgi:hypothetical protein
LKAYRHSFQLKQVLDDRLGCREQDSPQLKLLRRRVRTPPACYAEAIGEVFGPIVNLLREHASDAAIAFNTTVPGFYEAAARRIPVPEPVSA